MDETREEEINCSAGEEAGRNVEHVGDGVFEATDDKDQDWEDYCEDFSLGCFSGESEPDSEADEDVAEKAKNESRPKFKGDFLVGD